MLTECDSAYLEVTAGLMLLLAPSQVEVVWVKQSGLLLDSMLDPDSAEQQVTVCGVCVCPVSKVAVAGL